MSCLVFAYGSNMCRQRLVQRVPSAVAVGVGALPRHRLAMHKRGRDGSAKADAFYTGQEHDTTWGVVFQIDTADKPALDKYESLGVGYDCVASEIQTPGGQPLHAWTYNARTDAIADGLKPFAWYKRFLVHGARQHDLPADYIQFLESLAATPDPDHDRRRANEKVLGWEVT